MSQILIIFWLVLRFSGPIFDLPRLELRLAKSWSRLGFRHPAAKSDMCIALDLPSTEIGLALSPG